MKDKRAPATLTGGARQAGHDGEEVVVAGHLVGGGAPADAPPVQAELPLGDQGRFVAPGGALLRALSQRRDVDRVLGAVGFALKTSLTVVVARQGRRVAVLTRVEHVGWADPHA